MREAKDKRPVMTESGEITRLSVTTAAALSGRDGGDPVGLERVLDLV